MTPVRTTVLIGATGLIGGQLYRLLESDPWFGTIRVLLRRPATFDGPRTESKLVNFDDAESFRLGLEDADIIFCAIGTTQKKVAGDEAAYRRVDFDIPVGAAHWGKAAGAKKLLLVSSVGADIKSRNFYLRLKGETEEAVIATGLPSVSLFRPSMLLGKRAENRPGERIGQVGMQLFSGLLLGGLRKYKPIAAGNVVAAMIAQAKKETKPVEILEYDAIRELARRSD